MQFQDKVVLVTGAGSGIGAGVALAFARAGARVMLADINAEQGQQCLAAIEAEGGQATFFQVDVTSAAQMRDLVTATVSRFGRLDVVHNNAGISGSISRRPSSIAWSRSISRRSGSA